MSAAEKHEAKLRELVETAGFELAVGLDAPGRFRIVEVVDGEWSTVGWASTSSKGFEVTFPQARVTVTTPTGLVDELEKWKEQS